MHHVTIRDRTGTAVIQQVAGDLIRIGRGEGNHVTLEDTKVSRFHAEIRGDGGQWTLVDLGSRNGTRLNGRPVTLPIPVKPGDEIGVGRMVLTLRRPPPGARAGGRVDTTGDVSSARVAPGDPVLVGISPAIAEARAMVERVAGIDAAVLVTGESGTGKELVARLIHRLSTRSEGPLVVVNCPALPGGLLDAELFGVERGVATGVDERRGRLEMAAGGTLFLDEIADLELAAQARLLRFLQDRTVERVGGRTPVRVDARVVSATNRDLDEAMARGTFRIDLYHRLSAVSIHIPPLRERREDIATLTAHILEDKREGLRLDEDATALLFAYDFPGNVRELEQVIQVAAATARGLAIRPADLPVRIRDYTRRAAGAPPDIAPDLFQRIVTGGESFWDLVHGPYLRRELKREDVQGVIATGKNAAGGSYKGMARLFRMEGEYRRLINFLAHHQLRPPE